MCEKSLKLSHLSFLKVNSLEKTGYGTTKTIEIVNFLSFLKQFEVR